MTSLIIGSFVILLAALVGGGIPLLRSWKEVHLHQFISFGAGVLIGATFLHMIPEAIELIGSQVGMAVLIGFLVFYFIEKFVMIHACSEGDCEYHHIGVPAFLGFSFHSFTDGIALGASYLVPALTPYVFVALISHRVPTSFAFTSILKVSRYSTKRILILLFIFAVMLPVGAILSHSMLNQWSQSAVGWAIGISAGTFIHIALCDLLPEIHKVEERKLPNLVCFILGLVLMVILNVVLGHAH